MGIFGGGTTSPAHRILYSRFEPVCILSPHRWEILWSMQYGRGTEVVELKIETEKYVLFYDIRMSVF